MIDTILKGYFKTLLIYIIIKFIEIIANEINLDPGYIVCVVGTLYFVIKEKFNL